MNLVERCLDRGLLHFLGLQNFNLVFDACYLEVDVVTHSPDRFGFLFLPVLLDFLLFFVNGLDLESSAFVECYLLGQQTDQVLDFVGLLS